ncbi:MFS transporter, partial [Mycobacterium sp. E136]|uniref:MFS transporter n=1 Tax=Mycobacterium sp. E136 TaxID=1834125 RepID=UPI000A8C3DB8
QRGASALATAWWFIPLPLTYLVLIPVVNAMTRRTNPRTPMTAGLLLMATGLGVYACVGPQANIWLLEAAFVLAGAGLALNTAPAVGLAMSAMPIRRSGLASGVVNLARLVGITVGVASLGSIMAAVDDIGGVRAALALGVAALLAGALITYRSRPAAFERGREDPSCVTAPRS